MSIYQGDGLEPKNFNAKRVTLANMNRILKKPIAVLGGGACGQTFAADLTLAGCKAVSYTHLTLPTKRIV